MKSWNEIRKAGTVFSKRRKGAYDEKSRAQSFLKEFFEVFGIDTCTQATFEHRVKFSDGSQGFVEYFWGNDVSGTGQGAGGVGGLLATRIDGVLYFPVYDGNGNIMMYVNAAGEVVAQYDYDPYGNTLQATGSLASQFAFGFSTKCHDREVGLVAYQLRVYNPVHGRWLNRDPIGEDGGENLYGFVGNSPQFKIDLLGENIFSSAFPPLGGYNAPPYVVRQPEIIKFTPSFPLWDDAKELERILLSWCPRNAEKYKTKWSNGGMCCPEACRKQAHAIADEIYREVSGRQTYFQGCVGNVMGLFNKSFGMGCVDWKTHVLRACKHALSVYEPKCRCFNPVEKEFIFVWPYIEHNWIDIVTPRGDGHVYVDPWPTGGRRLLLY